MSTKLRVYRVLVVLVFVAACLAIPKIDSPILFIAAAVLATVATVAALMRLARHDRAHR